MKSPIHKYDVSPDRGVVLPDGNVRVTIPFPSRAKILNVDSQNGRVIIWAIAGARSQLQERDFIVAPTGFSEVDSDWNYIGTAVGNTVWHVFEED